MTGAPATGSFWSPESVALVVLGGLLATAFFSGSETGFMSVSPVRLRHGPHRDSLVTRRLLRMLGRLDQTIMTCLIGTNLANVLISAVVTSALTARYGPRGEWFALVSVSAVVIIFGEILPKVLYREYPERLTRASVPAISVAMAVAGPVRLLLSGYSALWRRLLPSGDDTEGTGLDRRSLAALLLTNTMPGEADPRFTRTLQRFLKMANLDVQSIMRPLAELQTIDPAITVGQCLRLAAASGYSRLPVADPAGSALQGYVLVRDLLFLPREEHDRPVPRTLWRSVPLVDGRMSPYGLFEEFRSRGRQLAVVVDPAGNALGLITLEDLIEKVIGSIQDEFDPTPDDGSR